MPVGAYGLAWAPAGLDSNSISLGESPAYSLTTRAMAATRVISLTSSKYNDNDDDQTMIVSKETCTTKQKVRPNYYVNTRCLNDVNLTATVTRTYLRSPICSPMLTTSCLNVLTEIRTMYWNRIYQLNVNVVTV